LDSGVIRRLNFIFLLIPSINIRAFLYSTLNLLVGIDVCIEGVVVDCGKEAYIGETMKENELILRFHSDKFRSVYLLDFNIAKAFICMLTFIDRINSPFVIFQNFTVLSQEPLINVCSSYKSNEFKFNVLV
jgi:hypothetical protein